VSKIRIIAPGRDKDAWVSDGCAHYTKLLSRWVRLDWRIINNNKIPSSLSPAEIMKAEAELITGELPSRGLIGLSDKGNKYSSVDFSKQLQKWQTNFGAELTFLIGGTYGIDQTLLDRADGLLSLSPLTFSHQLVRMVLAEQLYRGYSILNGTDYHK
jgi:23S rRNA (pseudouridine1915-N3)-methyltransferase